MVLSGHGWQFTVFKAVQHETVSKAYIYKMELTNLKLHQYTAEAHTSRIILTFIMFKSTIFTLYIK